MRFLLFRESKKEYIDYDEQWWKILGANLFLCTLCEDIMIMIWWIRLLFDIFSLAKLCLMKVKKKCINHAREKSFLPFSRFTFCKIAFCNCFIKFRNPTVYQIPSPLIFFPLSVYLCKYIYMHDNLISVFNIKVCLLPFIY